MGFARAQPILRAGQMAVGSLPNDDRYYSAWRLTGSLSAIVLGWTVIRDWPDYDAFVLVGAVLGFASGFVAAGFGFSPDRSVPWKRFLWKLMPIYFLFAGAGLGWIAEIIWRAASA